MYVHVYGMGHLIEFSYIPIYLAKFGNTYIVINALNLYPISFAEKEVIALSHAKARKEKETRDTIISLALNVSDKLWNWGDIFLEDHNDGNYVFINDPEDLSPTPFTRYGNTNIFMGNKCTIVFDSCYKYPLYLNLELCVYNNSFHFFVYTNQKGRSYLSQSPLVFERYGDRFE